MTSFIQARTVQLVEDSKSKYCESNGSVLRIPTGRWLSVRFRLTQFMARELSTGPPPGDPSKNRQENCNQGPPKFQIEHPKQLILANAYRPRRFNDTSFGCHLPNHYLFRKTTTFLSQFLAGMIVVKNGWAANKTIHSNGGVKNIELCCLLNPLLILIGFARGTRFLPLCIVTWVCKWGLNKR